MQLRSKNSYVSTFMRFENRTGEYVKLYWYSYDGDLVAYRTLPPNTAFRQQSFVSHPWTFKCIPFHPMTGRCRDFTKEDEMVVVDNRVIAYPEPVERPYVLRKPTKMNWSMEKHFEFFPEEFKEMVRELLLSHHRLRHEPLAKKRTHGMVTRSRGPAEDPQEVRNLAATKRGNLDHSLRSHCLDEAVFERNYSGPRVQVGISSGVDDIGCLPMELLPHIIRHLAPEVPYILPPMHPESDEEDEFGGSEMASDDDIADEFHAEGDANSDDDPSDDDPEASDEEVVSPDMM